MGQGAAGHLGLLKGLGQTTKALIPNKVQYWKPFLRPLRVTVDKSDVWVVSSNNVSHSQYIQIIFSQSILPKHNNPNFFLVDELNRARQKGRGGADNIGEQKNSQQGLVLMAVILTKIEISGEP
jgi:hypothetical protein